MSGQTEKLAYRISNARTPIICSQPTSSHCAIFNLAGSRDTRLLSDVLVY